ncbi:MAG: 1-propanol dehydrogenase PduQ [Flavonifractor plautii]
MERFQLKPTIFFGPDALAALEGLAGRRVMVITDSFLAQSGLLERVRARLRDCTVEVFDQVVPDPPLELVAQGARALAEFRPDAVVAFGGGSPMDCAKAMLEFGKKLGAGADIRFVAVPTTAGTGSEVTSFAVLTDRAKGVKYPLVDDALLPDEAILDPSLLAGVPPAVTADTGMDVLTHAAEAYVARGPLLTPTPWRRRHYPGLAEPAPRLGNGGESGAKGNMLLASNLAGIAFNAAGLGICHSLAHALGGRFHLPHGRLNALILPHVIHFNAADGTAAEKYGRLARLCGLAANPRSLAAGLNRLRAQLKLPERLSACGVEGKELTAALDGLAEAAQADLCAPSNPRPAAAEDLKSLLRELA